MKRDFRNFSDVTVFRDGQFIAEREVATLTEDSLSKMMVWDVSWKIPAPHLITRR